MFLEALRVGEVLLAEVALLLGAPRWQVDRRRPRRGTTCPLLLQVGRHDVVRQLGHLLERAPADGALELPGVVLWRCRDSQLIQEDEKN